MIRTTVFTLAAVLAAGSIATAAQAGTAPLVMTVNGLPNPSSIGQTVTFTATFSGPAAACSATIRDMDNAVDLCTTGSTAGTNAATCSAAFATAGPRTVQVSGTFGGCPTNGAVTYFHTVNAVATVPTVGEWTMWGLAGLLLMFGAGLAARHVRRTHGDDGLSAG